MKTIEKILWAFFAGSILLRILANIHFLWIAIAGMILSFFYLIFTIFLLTDINKPSLTLLKDRINSKRIFLSILLGCIFSVACISIMFKALRWPGSTFMQIFSIILLLIVLIISFLKRKKTTDISMAFYENIYKRDVIILIVCIACLCVSLLPAELQNQISPPIK